MANIIGNKDTRKRIPVDEYTDPVAAATHLYMGAAVLKNASGYLVNAASGVTGTTRGVMIEEVDNSTGDAGDESGRVRSGVFEFKIDQSDAVVDADSEAIVYWLDNQTVSKTSNSGARPVAGRLKKVEGSGSTARALVAVGPLFSVDGDLVAANNLSDVASAATARANIGANKGEISVLLPTLVAGVFYIPLPDRAVTITKLKVAINGALTAADLVVTPAINTTNITGGAVTVTQAGSAAGNQAEATPSAANVSDGADELLRLTLSGNTAAVTGVVTVEYTW